MKKFIISDNGSVGFDTETEDIFSVRREREAISCIYIVPEAMRVVVDKNNKKDEFDVKKDDLVIVFYDQDYEKQVIAIKSKDWIKNIKKYNELMQKRKEGWAKNNSGCEDCESV